MKAEETGSIKYKGVSVQVDFMPPEYDEFRERDMRQVRASADTIHGHWILLSEVSDMLCRCRLDVFEYVATECYQSFIRENEDLEWI
jgi:hypothetical protein